MRKLNTNARTARAFLKIAMAGGVRAARVDLIYLTDGDFVLGIPRGTVARRAYMAVCLTRAASYVRQCAWLDPLNRAENIMTARSLLANARQLRIHAPGFPF